MNRSLAMIAAATILTTFSLFGRTDDRHAFVIGNDSYVHAHALLNAKNDARDVAESFKILGYSVTLALDVNHEEMNRALTLFTQNLLPGDVAIVYYSGHGFQVDGDNYLVPIDFGATTEAEGREQGYSVSAILTAIATRGARVQIIILDACRDNPFFSSRSTKAGWADTGVSAGTLIAFGTSPGATSSDNPTGRNGLFTKAFLSHISSALSIEDLLKQVRKDTIIASSGGQTPWIASSLIGEFYINRQFENPATRPSEVSLDDQLSRSVEVTSRITDPRSIRSSKAAESQIPVDSKSADILVNQGMLLAQQGNYAEAVRSLSAALVSHPGYSIALRVLGLIFHLLGRGADAAAQFSRAINADPSDSFAYAYRGAELTNTDPTAAIRDCYAAVAIAPRFLAARLLLVNALVAGGKTDAALREITTTLSLAPESGRAYALRARINRELGQYEAADKDIKRAVSLSMVGLP